MRKFSDFIVDEKRHEYLLKYKIDDSRESIFNFWKKMNSICDKVGVLYSWNNDIYYSFENFCEDNNIDLDNKILYDNALEYFDAYHWHSTNLDVYTAYDYYQDEFYETLSQSLDLSFINKYIKKVFGDKILDICENIKTINTASSKKHIDIVTTEELDYDDFATILNFVNYCIIDVKNINNETIYTIKPNVSDEVTDKIHEQKYLYHVTSKHVLNKILKFGLHPKSKVKNDWTKVFVFTNQNNLLRRIKSFWDLQTRLRKYNLPDIIKDEIDYTPVLLKIDISKLPKEMKFFIDDNYSGTNAYYTFEPISPSAILEYKELDEVDNKFVE